MATCIWIKQPDGTVKCKNCCAARDKARARHCPSVVEEKCPHLGEPFDDDVQVFGCGCKTEGVVMTRVYECKLYGECAPLTNGKSLADESVRICRQCPEYPGRRSRAS